MAAKSKPRTSVAEAEHLKQAVDSSLTRTAFIDEKSWPADGEAICELGVEMKKRLQSAEAQLDDALEKEHYDDAEELKQEVAKLKKLRDRYRDVLITTTEHEKKWRKEIARMHLKLRDAEREAPSEANKLQALGHKRFVRELTKQIEDLEHKHQVVWPYLLGQILRE